MVRGGEESVKLFRSDIRFGMCIYRFEQRLAEIIAWL
jgi:hypothetical protein